MSEFIDVDASFGKVRGYVRQFETSKVGCFFGIPYAKQPVGPLRFKPLQPLESKLDNDESPFLATQYGPSSIQTKTSFFSTKHPMSEACIYLNIYSNLGYESDGCEHTVPSLDDKRKPVFFHIHGGAFIRGSGAEPYYNMMYFAARHDAVCVSINYRLSTLGFLSYPPVIEENLGLKDQQFALKWTHENIGCFGGDPDNVTIFGCSAGGASVHFHLMSRESCKYFSRAIAISGTFNKAWCRTPRTKQREKVNKLLKKFHCPSNLTSPEQIRDFLTSLPSSVFEGLGEASVKSLNDEFIPVDVFEDCEGGMKVYKKPLILGITAEEGNLFPDFVFPRSCNDKPTWARGVIADLVTETHFGEPLRQLVSQLSTIPNYPFSVYLFDYNCQSRSNILPESHLRWHYGKFHSCDVPFILSGVAESSDILKPSGDDLFVSKTMANMIGSFIHADDERFPLELYQVAQRVNRISEYGITAEDPIILRSRRNLLYVKTIAAGLLLISNSNKF